jgi:putative acetyltransferase
VLLIREEMVGDHEAVRAVNRLAFGGDEEAALVDRLPADGLAVASVVAVEGGEIAGHVLFSELPVETDRGTIPAVSLAPMAVRPEWQKKGLGSALVGAGLDLCRVRGKAVVIVLGHPRYYPRFGFSAELASRIECPFPGAGDAWMALELAPGALSGITGTVCYPAAFGLVEP